MRHRMAKRKLGRTSSHRSALFRNQLASMIASERIVTTLPKAKELRPIVEKMVTLAKEDSVHHRRLAARSIADRDVLTKLFDEISPRFTDRPGGYTRIVKLGPRRGDGAEMAILEFVDYELGQAPAAPEKPKKSRAKKAAPAEEETGEESAEPEEEAEPKPKKKPARKSAAGKAKKPGAKGGASKKSGASRKSTAKKSSSKKTASRKGSSSSRKGSSRKKG